MATRTLTPAPAELDRWRRDTPGCRDRIHLNNAGAGLMPRPVLDALTDHLAREAAIGGYEAADEAEPRVRETYALVAQLVGAAPRNVALVENATVAFSQALSAFDFRPGDRIVTTRTDYPSNQLVIRERVEHGAGHEPRARVVEVDPVPTSGRVAAPAVELDRGGGQRARGHAGERSRDHVPGSSTRRGPAHPGPAPGVSRTSASRRTTHSPAAPPADACTRETRRSRS